MDAKQVAGMRRQMMAGESAEGGEAGVRGPCGQMAAMFGGGEAAGMFKCCGQMAEQFAGQGETAEEPEHSEPQGPQVA